MGLFTSTGDSSVAKFTDKVVENEVASSYGKNSGGSISILDQLFGLDPFYKGSNGLPVNDGLNSIFGSLWPGLTISTNTTMDSMNEYVRQGVTGLYNFKAPSDSQFAECQDVGGLSVWNHQGWWRCLFPEAKVAENIAQSGLKSAMENVLTKEKIENDLSHRFGLFFTDFTGYLSWKRYMNKLVAARLESKRLPDAAELAKTPEDMMLVLSENSDKNIIGSSKYTTMNRTSEGDTEQVCRVKTYYDDGTVLIKTDTKKFPKDGGEPIVRHEEKHVPADQDR